MTAKHTHTKAPLNLGDAIGRVERTLADLEAIACSQRATIGSGNPDEIGALMKARAGLAAALEESAAIIVPHLSGDAGARARWNALADRAAVLREQDRADIELLTRVRDDAAAELARLQGGARAHGAYSSGAPGGPTLEDREA